MKNFFVPILGMTYHIIMVIATIIIFKSLKLSLVKAKRNNKEYGDFNNFDIQKLIFMLLSVIFLVFVLYEFTHTEHYLIYYDIMYVSFPTNTMPFILIYPSILISYSLVHLVRYITSSMSNKIQNKSANLADFRGFIFANAVLTIWWLIFIFVLIGMNGIAQR